jgi:cytochrome c biogenesis protein CcmG, thiol:disulfide interchange protein DsbE
MSDSASDAMQVSAPSNVKRRMIYFVPLLVLAAMAVIFKMNLGRDTKLVPSPFIGKSIPSFQTTDLLTQAPISTQTLRGQAFVLNVWASWCVTCRIEHRVFNDYGKLPNALPIVGLNYKDAPEDAKRWLDQLGNPYQHIAVDQNGSIGLDLGVYGAPETYFIDANGIVRYKHIGEMTMPLLQAKTAELGDAKGAP